MNSQLPELLEANGDTDTVFILGNS